MNGWRQAAGNHSKDILYPRPKDNQHIEEYARAMNAKGAKGKRGRGSMRGVP